MKTIRICLAGICAAVLMALVPVAAFADGDGAEAVIESNTALPQDSIDAVSVDEAGRCASVDGAPFALDEFSRARSGTIRTAEDGAFLGYGYYCANEPGRIAVVVTDGYAVVYVPRQALDVMGMTLEEASSSGDFAATLAALDHGNAKGGELISGDIPWYFTSDPSFERDGAVFMFDQQAQEGRYFALVVGADGTDVTDEANPHYVHVTQVDFATAVASGGVAVEQAPTGLAAFAAFLSNLDMSPLYVTLKTSLTAIVFVFVLGLLAAYFSMRISPRAQDIFDSICTIPMVLPPTVCGFLLLLLLGRNTALGQWFIDIGFPLVFSWPATVIAAVVVAFPLMYRSARGAFEGLDPNMLDAARTLGWSNGKIFFRLMLPLAWSSIAAGTVLAFARALGEFGATLFLAGNYLGITRTIPIAIYFEWMNGNTDIAIFWTVVIMVFSFIVILFINLWSRRTTKYRRGTGE